MRRNSQTLYAVIGIGRFGFALAQELAAKGKDVLVVDCDRAKIDAAAEFAASAFVADVTKADALREAGVGEADIAVIGIGGKLDTSILTAMQVIRLGVKRVIAKATSVEQGQILEMLGAEVVYPEHDMAIRLAGKLVAPYLLEFISLSDTVALMEIRLTERVEGKTVVDLNLRRTFGLNIIGIRREGKMNTDIEPGTVLRSEDTLTVIGKTADIRRFEEFLH